jgi:hypothetical protein
MPAVPQTKTTWVNDVDALDSTNLHAYVRDPIAFLMRKPSAMLRQATNQSIANNTWTAITFGVEDWDDDPDGTGGHSTSSNTSRYTARYPGVYLLGGGVGWAASSAGVRGTRWAKNGTALNGSSTLEPPTASGTAYYAARAIKVELDEGDYVELFGFQNSGGSLNTTVATSEQPSMSVGWDRLIVA